MFNYLFQVMPPIIAGGFLLYFGWLVVACLHKYLNETSDK